MPITDGLITLADAKAQLGIATATTTYDTDIELYVEAATPIIEAKAGPRIARSRTFVFNGGGSVLTLPVKFNAVTAFTVDGVAETDYVTDASKGLIYAGTTDGLSTFEDGVQNISVTVTVGAATVPSNVKLATRELVRHWWQTSRQANRPGTADDVTSQPLPIGVSRRIDELLMASQNVGGFA